MKKRIVIIGVVIILIMAGVLMWNKLRRMEAEKKIVTGQLVVSETQEENSGITSVMATADTLEEAESIAELYGITLTKFSYGVAVFETDQDVDRLIKMGKEKGYPELERNYVGRMDNK